MIVALVLSAFSLTFGPWFLALFCLFRSASVRRDPQSGAPLSPQLGRKALIATGIAIVLWVVFYALIAFKVLDL